MSQADVLCLFVAFDQDLLGFRWRLQEGTLISTDFPLYTTELTLASLHTSAPRVAYLCHGLFHCVRGWYDGDGDDDDDEVRISPAKNISCRRTRSTLNAN